MYVKLFLSINKYSPEVFSNFPGILTLMNCTCFFSFPFLTIELFLSVMKFFSATLILLHERSIRMNV